MASTEGCGLTERAQGAGRRAQGPGPGALAIRVRGTGAWSARLCAGWGGDRQNEPANRGGRRHQRHGIDEPARGGGGKHYAAGWTVLGDAHHA
jgi:hypothetical protein